MTAGGIMFRRIPGRKRMDPVVGYYTIWVLT
jgi:hypothetical protein